MPIDLSKLPLPRKVTPELEQAAFKLVLECVNRGILAMDNDGIHVNSALMREWAVERGVGKGLEKHGFKLLIAAPAKLRSLLREQNYDGSQDWEQNKELIDWLRDRPGFEWLAQFPLAGRDPKSVV